MLVDLHLSVINRSSRARAWAAQFTEGYANHCTTSPPPLINIRKTNIHTNTLTARKCLKQVQKLHILQNGKPCRALVYYQDLCILGFR